MDKKKSSKEHVKVFVRCRPSLESELNSATAIELHPQVSKILVRELDPEKTAVKTYTFDKVFGPEASQEDIYLAAVKPLIEEVIQGFNCTIFAYGQTGTGKTFTIEGGRTSNIKDPTKDPLSGIIPRSMQNLFTLLIEKKWEYEIFVTFLELYNEDVYDLLSNTDDLVKLKMFDNSSLKGSVIVQGLRMLSVKCMEEMYSILDQGFKKRRKASTLLNTMSSRSHTVFTVTVKVKENSSTHDRTRTGKLNLVDLAGSENIRRSGSVNQRAREAGSINQSLLALGRVINSLCENAAHIPYRQSKLTRLLQDSLGGQTKTSLIATISPCAIHLEETLNTLDYALRVKSITNKPEVNAQIEPLSLTKDYLEEKNRIKKEINRTLLDGSLYVDEDRVNHWKEDLFSKREENWLLMCQLKALMEEDKLLDASIQDEENGMEEDKKTLSEMKLKNEELREQVLKKKEECKKSKMMLVEMKQTRENLHEKLHTKLEEKRVVKSELKKAIKQRNAFIEERRNLQEKMEHLHSHKEKTTTEVRNSFEEFSKSVTNMLKHQTAIITECEVNISNMKSDLESAGRICENEFVSLYESINNLEAFASTFQKNFAALINEQESVKFEKLDKLVTDSVESKESCKFTSMITSLSQVFNDCQTKVLAILSLWREWKNAYSSKMTMLKKDIREYGDKQNKDLKSTVQLMNTMLNKLKEHFDAYNKIISNLAKSDESDKFWKQRFLEVENALSSLDCFCTEHVKNEVDKAVQAQNHLKEFSACGQESSSNLLTYSENSLKEFPSMQKEITERTKNILRGDILDDMKTHVISCGMKHKDCDSKLKECFSMGENSKSHSNSKVESDEQKDLVQFQLFPLFQEICDLLSNLKEVSKRVLVENSSKFDKCLTEKNENIKGANESMKTFPSTVSNITKCIKEVEMNASKHFLCDESQMNDCFEYEPKTLNDETLQSATSSMFWDGFDETLKDCECQFCPNKPEETLLATNQTINSFFSNLEQQVTSTPAIRMPSCSKNKVPDLKNLPRKVSNPVPRTSRSGSVSGCKKLNFNDMKSSS